MSAHRDLLANENENDRRRRFRGAPTVAAKTCRTFLAVFNRELAEPLFIDTQSETNKSKRTLSDQRQRDVFCMHDPFKHARQALPRVARAQYGDSLRDSFRRWAGRQRPMHNRKQWPREACERLGHKE